MNKTDSETPLKIWIVEDDPDYLISLKSVLDYEKGMSCDATFDTTESVLSALQSLAVHLLPDIILLDIHLPGKTGIEGLSYIKSLSPDTSVIMVSFDENEELIYNAFRSGASGYLTKDASSKVIVRAIREVVTGGTLMPPAVAEKVLHYFRDQKPAADRYGLTDREKEVLEWMSKGLSQKQIAENMFLSPYTVNSHVQKIYIKLHVNSGIAAIVKALREKII